MASAVAPPTTPKTTTSVDPMFTQAVAQAKAALQPQLDTVAGEQAASDAQYAQRETDATNVAAALSKLLQPIGPAVTGEYQTAAQNQELAARGFSQGMQDALQGNTDNLNAMLQKLGQPTQLDSHAQEAGDVLYGLGGYNPGTAFSKEGAAFGAAASLQAGDAILRGQENVKDLTAKSLIADQGFQQKLADIAAKLPGDTQTNYTKLQQMAIENKRLALQIKNDAFNQTVKLKQLKLQVAKYNTSIDEFNARQQLAYSKFARQQFQQNRAYALSLSRLGIAQKSLQLRITQAAYRQANGGYSEKDTTKLAEQALGYAQQAFNGQTRYQTQTVNGVKTSVPVKTGRISYGQAMTQMLKKGIPVQIVLASLNQVYGTPTPKQEDEIAKALGPLAPDALIETVTKNQMNTTPPHAPKAPGGYASNTYGSSLSTPANPAGYAYGGGFVPSGVPFTMGRADQGRDIQTRPGSPIVAPGAGVVVRIGSDPGGGGAHFGPSYPIVHFTSGPYAGKTMYIGHTVAALQAGQKFSAGAVLSHTVQSSPLNGGAPDGWAEIGFAPNGTPGGFGQQPPF